MVCVNILQMEGPVERTWLTWWTWMKKTLLVPGGFSLTFFKTFEENQHLRIPILNPLQNRKYAREQIMYE